MKPRSQLKIALALSFGFLIMPTEAAAYTCWNPAICKAICGAETCLEATKNNYKPVERFSTSDMERELREAPRDSAVADVLRAVMSSGDSTSAGYTCWNPAICIAVCGKKTC